MRESNAIDRALQAYGMMVNPTPEQERSAQERVWEFLAGKSGNAGRAAHIKAAVCAPPFAHTPRNLQMVAPPVAQADLRPRRLTTWPPSDHRPVTAAACLAVGAGPGKGYSRPCCIRWRSIGRARLTPCQKCQIVRFGSVLTF